MSAFAPAQDLVIDLDRIGRSGETILIIDGFLAEPDTLVAAASQVQWREMAPGGYPGRRAALPGAYARALLRRLDRPIRQRLLPPGHRLSRFDCAFSMVTRSPAQLDASQRVPHIDIAHPTRVAILHYLCDPAFGGTAFFRQDATGLEQIDPENRQHYLDARARDLAALRPQDRYPNTTTPGYTRTAWVAARFNRVIVYRSFTLHSGIIDAPDRLSADPRTGRLTATFFVDYAQEVP
jgi:hypothetical protein